MKLFRILFTGLVLLLVSNSSFAQFPKTTAEVKTLLTNNGWLMDHAQKDGNKLPGENVLLAKSTLGFAADGTLRYSENKSKAPVQTLQWQVDLTKKEVMITGGAEPMKIIGLSKDKMIVVFTNRVNPNAIQYIYLAQPN